MNKYPLCFLKHKIPQKKYGITIMGLSVYVMNYCKVNHVLIIIDYMTIWS